MPGGVAGHVEHREMQADHLDGVAVVQRRERARDLLAGRTEDGTLQMRPQIGDAADMVRVVVRH